MKYLVDLTRPKFKYYDDFSKHDEQILLGYIKERKNSKDVAHLINYGFYWANTKQGRAFWNNLYKVFKHGEPTSEDWTILNKIFLPKEKSLQMPNMRNYGYDTRTS